MAAALHAAPCALGGCLMPPVCTHQCAAGCHNPHGHREGPAAGTGCLGRARQVQVRAPAPRQRRCPLPSPSAPLCSPAAAPCLLATLSSHHSSSPGCRVCWLRCRGTLGTLAKVAREEGVASLYKGLVPGLHRQILLGGVRIATCERLHRHAPRQMPHSGGRRLHARCRSAGWQQAGALLTQLLQPLPLTAAVRAPPTPVPAVCR